MGGLAAIELSYRRLDDTLARLFRLLTTVPGLARTEVLSAIARTDPNAAHLRSTCSPQCR
ncbi:MAG TPA: hypothetical protein VFW64_21155 [Pseudonocardiaceae bacterium]|nr:hypothetical protein [Pseudonocardiaceae bacterium]